MARNYCEAYYHPGYSIATNGEDRVLRLLQSSGLATIFDVGANTGEWSECAITRHPSAQIEAFEAIPETASHLARLRPNVRFHFHSFGLGGTEATCEMTYYGSAHSFLSSAVYRTHVVPGETRKVLIRRGAEVAAELKCMHIDLLKIDVEGMEYDVLDGFSSMLSPVTITYIQFEHHSGGYKPLRAFYDLLEPRGYRIGKIYRRSVDFSPYDNCNERYAGPNYLAIPADAKEMLLKLSHPSD